MTIEPGDRATIALEELDTAFEAVLSGYLKRLAEVAATEPWASDKLRALALAQQIGAGVRQQLVSVVQGQAIEDANRVHRRKIESMSPERKSILGLGR